MGKSKGIKYSSYLDDLGQLRLEKFCDEFDCSKAKAIIYLLELWENGTINNKLATVSLEIQSELEKKLATSLQSKFESKFTELSQEIDSLKQKLQKITKQTHISNTKSFEQKLSGEDSDKL